MKQALEEVVALLGYNTIIYSSKLHKEPAQSLSKESMMYARKECSSAVKNDIPAFETKCGMPGDPNDHDISQMRTHTS